MTCYRPIAAYRGPDGIEFDSKRGWQDRPLELPCGSCAGCRAARARHWAIRCMHEAECHDSNSFVTLTYNDTYLPASGSLEVRDWQLFAKKLRKRGYAFRYFMAGEYGEKTKRPHYHAIMFGQDFLDDAEMLKTKPHRLWRSPLLEDVWGRGHVTVGHVTMGSAAYVAQYCMKKWDAPEEYGKLRRPFVTMSRRPGLGTRWFDKFGSDVFPSDECVVEGRRYSPPRFYMEKLGEAELLQVKRKRAAFARMAAEDQTPSRLRVRENVAEARLSLASRSAV